MQGRIEEHKNNSNESQPQKLLLVVGVFGDPSGFVHAAERLVKASALEIRRCSVATQGGSTNISTVKAKRGNKNWRGISISQGLRKKWKNWNIRGL